MAGIKSLADAHIRLAVLTTTPANPAVPTAAELAAGIDASCKIVKSDFNWTAAASDKVAEAALCDANNVNALGASNFTVAFTVFRYFNAGTGIADPTDDALWTAMKTKGTNLWVYPRETGKLYTAAWAAGDESWLGGQVLTDSPLRPDSAGGYIKRRIEMEAQSMFQNIVVA